MTEIFNSTQLKNIINKILLFVIFYIIAAASFNGFFVKWAFRDDQNRNSFERMYTETAKRPFVHRQLMVAVARNVNEKLPEDTKKKLSNYLKDKKHNFIKKQYANSKINEKHIIEYYLVYFMSFACLLISMFIWRKICTDLTGSKLAGTLTAAVFALIFPLFETVGGYFYDFGELLFFSLAALFAVRGWWLALIFTAPIAEYNKESFLFFTLTLFPLLRFKLGTKKALIVTGTVALMSGLVYLKILDIYAGNEGETNYSHFQNHINHIFKFWFYFEVQYGVYIGSRVFLPHVLLLIWMVKTVWNKIPSHWKNHMKIALVINVPLYVLFCAIGELRNLSMLYISLIVVLAFFIKGVAEDQISELLERKECLEQKEKDSPK